MEYTPFIIIALLTLCCIALALRGDYWKNKSGDLDTLNKAQLSELDELRKVVGFYQQQQVMEERLVEEEEWPSVIGG